MPASSKKQRIAMAIAEHEPGKLLERNKGMKKMTHQQLHEYASKIDRTKKSKGKKTKGNKNLYADYLRATVKDGGKV